MSIFNFSLTSNETLLGQDFSMVVADLSIGTGELCSLLTVVATLVHSSGTVRNIARRLGTVREVINGGNFYFD